MSNHSSPSKPTSGNAKAVGLLPNAHRHQVTIFTLNLAAVIPDQVELIDLDSGVPVAYDDQDTGEMPDNSAAGDAGADGADGEVSSDESSADDRTATTPSTAAVAAAAPVTHSCHICGRLFVDVLAQRAHFRSSWHTTNLQRKMRGESPLTEQEHTASNPTAAVSSTPAHGHHDKDGGNDDSEEDENDFSLYEPVSHTPLALSADAAVDFQTDASLLAPRTHAARTLLAFRLTTHPETLYTVHRAVFPTLFPWRPSAAQFHASLVSLSTPTTPLRVAYLMLGGGHFAGAIFDNEKCTAHASVHRYTTRRKQGGSQSAQDNQRHAKSAGASLRRYNEAALARDVWDQVAAWHDELQKAHIVFVVAPGVGNKRTLLQHPEGLGIAKDDKRIRGVPFTTRRPGYKEIIRVHRKLMSVGVQAYVEPAPEPIKVEAEPPQPVEQDLVGEQHSHDAEQPQQESGPEIVLARKKKRKPRASRKTGTLPQAASDSSSASDGSDNEGLESNSRASPPPSSASTSGPQRLGGGPPAATGLPGISSMVQGLGLAGMSADTRAALERERRARAAERRLGIASPPVHAVKLPQSAGRVLLTGAGTPSMQSAAQAVAAQLAATQGTSNSPAQLDPPSGPPCDECGQPVIKKALKKNGKQFCGIRCAAAAGKKA